MKIAIMSDIHGNSAALRAALDDVRRRKIERLLVLGDLVGYYYDARGVLDLLREWPFDAIRGNHETLLGDVSANATEADRYRAKYGSSLDVAHMTLSANDIAWLVSLPDRTTVSYGGLSLELCHGSPRDPDEYVYPDSTADTLDACKVEGRDVVLMGHTHYPFMSVRGTCVLLNPGSIGQARDRGGLASWCWIDTDTRTIVSEKTPYDTRALAAEARQRDLALPYLASVLERTGPPISLAEGLPP